MKSHDQIIPLYRGIGYFGFWSGNLKILKSDFWSFWSPIRLHEVSEE